MDNKILCKYCNKEKTLKEFGKCSKSKSGFNSKCKKCVANEMKIRRKNKTDGVKKSLLSPRINLTNKKFGKLSVIGISRIQNKHRKWLCVCECGNKIEAFGPNLKSGEQWCCGCESKSFTGNQNKLWTGYGEISGNFWGQIKKTAKRRNLDFIISIEDAWNLYAKQGGKCALTGLSINFGDMSLNKHKRKATASLDRIDSSKGYTIDNVQWVHNQVNNFKKHMNEKCLYNLCKLISDKLCNKYPIEKDFEFKYEYRGSNK